MREFRPISFILFSSSILYRGKKFLDIKINKIRSLVIYIYTNHVYHEAKDFIIRALKAIDNTETKTQNFYFNVIFYPIRN